MFNQMKKILITLLVLASMTLYGQHKYPLYSDVWSYECSGNRHTTLPKDGGSFTFNEDYVLNNINEKKIESYLLEALNKFRADYGKPPVKESAWLTRISDQYAYKIKPGYFGHDDLSKYTGVGVSMSENIALYQITTFTRITPEDGDINKIIADCYFDAYVHSDWHTDMLLSTKHEWFGFGLVIVGSRISGVVRSSSVESR